MEAELLISQIGMMRALLSQFLATPEDQRALTASIREMLERGGIAAIAAWDKDDEPFFIEDTPYGAAEYAVHRLCLWLGMEFYP